jgi:hypothetical protein
MPEIPTGMDKQSMKKLLHRARKARVSCAIAEGEGDTAGFGLLLLDRVKQPKAVRNDLGKQFPKAKNCRFGAALVDAEDDPKLVKFFVNKPIFGMAKKLVKTIKGTGFTKVQIVHGEPTR